MLTGGRLDVFGDEIEQLQVELLPAFDNFEQWSYPLQILLLFHLLRGFIYYRFNLIYSFIHYFILTLFHSYFIIDMPMYLFLFTELYSTLDHFTPLANLIFSELNNVKAMTYDIIWTKPR